MLTTIAIAHYRSLLDLVVPLEPLNVVTGENGSGKSNLYRALRLLVDTAQGGIVSSLAREGGLASTLWAGPESLSRGMRKGTVAIQGGARRDAVSLRLGFASEEMSYCIDLGLPIPTDSAFAHDPEIKRECIWSGPVLRPATLLVDRRGPTVRVRGGDDDWHLVTSRLSGFESMLTEVADPERAPEILAMRDMIRTWRFYDHFRMDADAPARQPQLATRTPVLSNDGRDVAAALQTILEIGDDRALHDSVTDAFAGSSLKIHRQEDRFSVSLEQAGLLRPLQAAELSDGTLRYLLWVAALLTPRPPALMVLNEPETSLHPDLLPALARLIARAAKESQVWVVSHASRLVSALREMPNGQVIVLEKSLGATTVQGQRDLDRPPWKWPDR
jgi:predicted ATPase